MNRPILLCSHPYDGQPPNAVTATCDTCGATVIYDQSGFETIVKATGEPPRKICRPCYRIIATEENIHIAGFTVGDKIAPFTPAGAEAARQWRLKNGAKS